MTAALVCPECGHEVRPPPDERLELGRLVLRGDICTAYVDGQAIRLWPRRTMLLAALMRYPQRPVPVDYLMSSSDMWGSPHTVNGHMSALRKQVGHAVEIRSEERVGYSIHPRGDDGANA